MSPELLSDAPELSPGEAGREYTRTPEQQRPREEERRDAESAPEEAAEQLLVSYRQMSAANLPLSDKRSNPNKDKVP